MRKSWPNEGAPAAASSLPFQSPRLVAAVAALYWVVSSFVAMRVPVVIVTLLSMVVIGLSTVSSVRQVSQTSICTRRLVTRERTRKKSETRLGWTRQMSNWGARCLIW